MPRRPSISVVIPTFDRAATIERAARSALAQEPPVLEVIVVDDGSTDGTAEVLARLAESEPRLVVLRLAANEGVPTARNRGAEAARGEWVAFLDSDDLFEPGHLARIADAIEATGGRATFYFADLRRPEELGRARQWELARFAIAGPHELRSDATRWVLRPRIPMMLQASVFRRDALLAAGGLWPVLRMRDDTHLFLRLGIGGSACAVAGVGTVMTSDGGDGRLTVALGWRTERYHELSVLLWSDLLARFDAALCPADRRLLKERLARAHLRLARIAAERGELPACGSRLWHAHRAYPFALPARVLESVRRRVPRRRAAGRVASGEASAL